MSYETNLMKIVHDHLPDHIRSRQSLMRIKDKIYGDGYEEINVLEFIYYLLHKGETIDISNKKQLCKDLEIELIDQNLPLNLKNIHTKGKISKDFKYQTRIFTFYEFAYLFKDHTTQFDNVQKYNLIIEAYRSFKDGNWNDFRKSNFLLMELPFCMIDVANPIDCSLQPDNITIEEVFEDFASNFHNLNYEYIKYLWIHFQNPYEWEKLNISGIMRRVISFDFCNDIISIVIKNEQVRPRRSSAKY